MRCLFCVSGAQLASETAAICNLWQALPPRNTIWNHSTLIRFDGGWCSKVIPAIRHSTAQDDAKSQHHHPFWWGMVQQSYPRHPPFHRAIRRETAAPSFVLMGDDAAKLSPSSAIPPCNTTRNRSTIIRFNGRWCKEITPLGVILLIGQGWWAQRKLPCLTTFATECYPLGGCTF